MGNDLHPSYWWVHFMGFYRIQWLYHHHRCDHIWTISKTSWHTWCSNQALNRNCWMCFTLFALAQYRIGRLWWLLCEWTRASPWSIPPQNPRARTIMYRHHQARRINISLIACWRKTPIIKLYNTLLVSLNQSFSWYFYHTASVRSLYSLLYSE